ncbi:hypothetical protein OM513_11730 [Sphingomonas canadensis]|uniref:hypothetical protein n=1 Tax=Sphingomonas canadensis TaxID=1219257 RepID=UPI00223217B6|nr:hypothetical protein [Sphingomonas canadensis]MCW3836714.1 hypothetical protein [Sphingomonas canadensis]
MLLLAPLMLVAACDRLVPDKVAAAKADAHKQAMAKAESPLDCMPPGADTFGFVCTIDRRQTQDGLILTLRHPDGGFRRLMVMRDGSGVAAADGAEAAVVTPLAPDLIEVAIGGGRYRLPATVRQPGGAASPTPSPATSKAKPS